MARGSDHPDFPETQPHVVNIACLVPLDGFHLTRAQLAAMPNPEEAAYRRGAAFTFDLKRYCERVQQLRMRVLPETRTIHWPSFDHAIKDPVENDMAIAPGTQIVFIEGLYTALDEEGWRDAANMMDELWFVELPMERAVERLVQRHVASGISPDESHARARVLASDMKNGQQVLDHCLPIQELIHSIEQTASATRLTCSHETGDPHEKQRRATISEMAANGGGC